MRSFLAFFKKECLEHVRSGGLFIFGLVFMLFGIMNPAIAKLTPWLMETLSDSLAESGMVVTTVKVDAMTSWVQFFKNIPMALIIFVLMESGIFTREYQSGTLVLVLTKGFGRWKVVTAKALLLLLLWTACYWFCFFITYGYNAYFWDNSIAQNLLPSVAYWWLLGVWTLSLVILCSVFFDNGSQVLLGTGGIFLASYLLGFLPKLTEWVPTHLMDSTSLIYGAAETAEYGMAVVVAIGCIILNGILSILYMRSKRL